MDSTGRSPPNTEQQASEVTDIHVFPVFEKAAVGCCSANNQARPSSASESSVPEEEEKLAADDATELERAQISTLIGGRGRGGPASASMLQQLVVEMKAMREEQAAQGRQMISILESLATEQTRSNKLLQEALYSQSHHDRGQTHYHHPYMEKLATSLDTVRREIVEIKHIAARSSPNHNRLH